MLVHRLVLLIGALIFFASCSPANNAVVLPTVASMPTVAPTATQSVPLPTFTLAPPISTLQVELTRAFSMPGAEVTEEAYIQNNLLGLKVSGTLTSQEIEYSHQLASERLEGLTRNDLATSIIIREMTFPDTKIEAYITNLSFSQGKFFISYSYRSDKLRQADYLSRLPYVLCGLREAGFSPISGQIRISLVSAKTNKETVSTKRCLNTDAVSQLNCEDPSRANVSTLLSDSGCQIIRDNS
jgi:hypothetical protein